METETNEDDGCNYWTGDQRYWFIKKKRLPERNPRKRRANDTIVGAVTKNNFK